MKVAIVGGGIVGLATAYQLLQRYPAIHLLLLEKENGPGRHQTGNNSGVLHSGLYYKPGTRKAHLAVQGIRRMVEFCERHGVPFEVCGKIVVATSREEIPRLDDLYERGTANGLKGLEVIGPERIREFEPHAAGIKAIRVPQEGIVDFPAVAGALTAEIRSRGAEVRFSSEVTQLKHSNGWRIGTRSGEYTADFLVNCAGLHCDRLSRMAGNVDSARIVPFRGEYYKLKPERQSLVRNLIYPVPDPKFPFLGVHFTRLIHGGIEAGPNAVLAFAREGYHASDVNLRDLVESITFRGFWRFLLRYPSMCWSEFRRSFSKALFCRSLQRLVPEIRIEDLDHGGAGVRAQALSPSGELLQDFYFVRQPRALHVLNAPSPAATASLSIADEIIDMMQDAMSA
ncbi:MAG TPA: L-2-hydroxyglutarate oxidase [Terracidiphilus sp.]|nr:L-2-hydroxyglutarate oxidase [Terracidiphilus sp.]